MNNIPANSQEQMMVNALIFGMGLMVTTLDEDGVATVRVVPPHEYYDFAQQLAADNRFKVIAS